MKQKRKLIRNLQREIENRQKYIEQIEQLPVDLICECFPGINANMWGNEVDFWFPFDFELIGTVKEFMNTHTDYKLQKETRHVDNNASHHLDYRAKGLIDVSFIFSTTQDGTTCVLNQIGTKTVEAKEVPIYEVICSEGAKETL